MAIEIALVRVKNKLETLLKDHEIVDLRMRTQVRELMNGINLLMRRLAEVEQSLEHQPGSVLVDKQYLEAVFLAEETIDIFQSRKNLPMWDSLPWIDLKYAHNQIRFSDKIKKIAGVLRGAKGSSVRSTINSPGESESEKFMAIVLDGDASFFQFSVVDGSASPGKETMLRKIYNDLIESKHFDCHGWVQISENFEKKKFVVDMMQQVSGIQENEIKPLHSLQQELQNFLIQRKYLVVLYDVRTPDIWEILKCLFPNSSNGSRVILIFREDDAVRCPDMEVTYVVAEDVDDGDVLDTTPQIPNTEFEELTRIFSDKESEVVGMENETVRLAGLVLSENELHCLVAVVGMAGSGKTTQVKTIYDHSYIREKFDCFAWVNVYVSNAVDEKNVLIDILKQVKKSWVDDELPLEELESELEIFLSQKRFLIVLDDVHAPSSWNRLSRVFPSKSDARVILITRYASVARRVDPSIVLLQVRPLNETESWSLFLKKLNRDGNDPWLINLKEKILQKCSGLPLAITLLGGYLSKKDYKEPIWSKLKEQTKEREEKERTDGEHEEDSTTQTKESEEKERTDRDQQEDSATQTKEREEKERTHREHEEDSATQTKEREEKERTHREHEEDSATQTKEREEKERTHREHEEDSATQTKEREEKERTHREHEEDSATQTKEREEKERMHREHKENSETQSASPVDDLLEQLISEDKLDPFRFQDTAYWKLSSRLKAYLHYLCLFPRSYEIPKRRLLLLWLAEDLAETPGDNKTIEDLIERDFDDLVQKHMIEVVTRKRDGRPKTCRLPSILYDNIYEDAQGMDLFHIHGKSDSMALSSSEFNVRRLAEHVGIQNNHPLSKFQNLRSYISFISRKGDKPADVIGNILTQTISKRGYGFLRVLDLEKVYKPVLPEAIGRLVLLRYVGLRWTFLDSISDSIGDLPCLETLDVKHTNLTTLPIFIWKAKKLRHLYMNENIHFPLSIQKPLASNSSADLQTLWGLLIGNNKPPINWLMGLKGLRRLGLTCHKTSLREISNRIIELKSLESLRLRSINDLFEPSDLHLGPMAKLHNLTDLYLVGKLTRAMDTIELPQSLIILTLSVSHIPTDPMQILGELHSLKILRLLAHSYIGEQMICHRGGFPQLLVLKLWMLKELKEWTVEEGAMTALRELEIRHCPKLKKPNGLEKLTTLREVTLTDMKEDFGTEFKKSLGKNTYIHKNQWDMKPSSWD